MKKTIGLVIILVVMLVALTGCAKVNYEIEVNEDGSGKISYLYGISKNKVGGVVDIVEQIAETMKEQAEESGYTVEPYEDDEISGFKANKYVQDLSKDFSLEEAFGKEYVKDTENNKINIEKGFFGTSYSQNAELDLTNLKDTGIEMIYKIKIPTKVKTSNATEIADNGKTLTWELKSGEINKIEFVAEKINMMPVVIIAVVVIAITIAIVVIILKKKHVTK